MALQDVFDGDITPDEIERWLSQFGLAERPIIERLVLGFRYYSLRRMNVALRRLYDAVVEHAKVAPDCLRFVPVGYVAKSGSAIAYYFRKQNKLREDRFVASTDIAIFESDASLIPVLLDDFIGSGHQSRQVLQELRSAAPGISQQVIFASVVGYEPGMLLLQDEPDVSAVVADRMTPADLPFANPSQLFPDERDRLHAIEIAEAYGKRLYPQYPLGYAHTQGLIGFFYSTPNNTLPIFWSSEAGWNPLLPHGESFRDPSYLFGPPSGLSKQLAARGPARPLIETNELEKYDVPEEMAVRIFGEFHQSQIFLVLAPILKELDITHEAFNALLAAISRMRHLEHEQKSVRAAILIASQTAQLAQVGEVVANAAAGLTLNRLDEVTSMAQLIDGLAGAVVARPDGRIDGVIMYPPGQSTDDAFLPARYRAAAHASRKADALLFLFNGAGRIFVFHRGARILSFRNASWHLQRADFRKGIAALSRQHRLRRRTLEEVVRIALKMADEGKGALITVGDHQSVLHLSDPPKTGHIAFAPMHVGVSPDNAVVGLMAQDGATVVAADGSVIRRFRNSSGWL